MSKENRRVVFACGRFNPPTAGHRKLLDEMRAVAEGAEIRIFTTQSHDPERNPLSPETKLGFLRRAFPGTSIQLATNPFDAAKMLAEEGFAKATLVVGADREALARNVVRYATDLGLESVQFHVISRQDDDASASAMREAAVSGDTKTFAELCPSEDAVLRDDMYRAVRLGMGDEWQT
jgi:nicotinic acid mononucleotide adenylyltransferase